MRTFVDLAKIYVKGGDGGRGSNAMRREKYVPRGGPFGGDGGRGGDVVFVVDPGLRTLLDFKYQRHFKAERGQHGKGKGMHGRSGQNLAVRVPPGTIVRDADTDAVLFDLVAAGQRAVVARGGRGGRGNMHFVTSTRQAPMIYEEGEPGEERWLILELKVLADVGLVGYPNAGKSTLISRVSAANAKVGNYPFTTLHPNLGVVAVGEESLVMADIPGLIENAHAGAGLGHEFLRHVERCRVLIHVLDGAGTEGRDPLDDFAVINRELDLYSPRLAAKPQLVAVNKMDLPGARERLPALRETLEQQGYQVYPISAVTGEGVEALLFAVRAAVAAAEAELPAVEVPAGIEAERVYRPEDTEDFTIERTGAGWVVHGRDIERLVAMTPWDNEEAVERFQRIFSRMGIEQALRQAGARDGDTVEIRGVRFDLSSPGQFEAFLEQE